MTVGARVPGALSGESPLQRAGAVALIEGGFDPVDAVEGPDGVEADVPDSDVAVTPSTGSVSRPRRSRCRPRRRRNRCSRPWPRSPSGRGPGHRCAGIRGGASSSSRGCGCRWRRPARFPRGGSIRHARPLRRQPSPRRRPPRSGARRCRRVSRRRPARP
ncbi:hypothetical protein DCW30_09980 [Streptomyces alfalfae]|nr:hypothetical protein D3X13_16230 [Streptomyces fradiae]RXX44799.1 hypothetical protein DCW30_09980 [Streptomyces alfalfae]RZM95406.1 hypothetical protein D4104_17835 [Streptomyces alfalfae]